MATRRSRLQFRPNIGPKTGKAQSAPAATRSQPKPKESDVSVTPSSEITKDTQPTSTGQTESELSNVGTPASVVQSVVGSESDEHETIQKESSVLNESTHAESQRVEPPGSAEKHNLKKVEEAVVKADEDASAVKTEVKPKSRSRFPKPRPNLADSGRPKTRTPASQVSNTAPASTNVVTPPGPPITKETPTPTTPTSPVKQSSIKDVDPPQPCTEKDFNIIESVNQTEEPVECRPAGVQLGLRESTDKKLHTAADKKLNTVIEKKTSTIGEKRKEHHSHRRLPSEYEPPNRQKLTMGDLIYWNPRKNVLKPKTKSKTNTSSEAPKPAGDGAVTEAAVDVENDDGDDGSLPVPQVKIGPDGNIILNEESLVIDNQEKDKTLDMEIVEEDETRPCGGFYGSRIQSRRWNVMETKQFYRALATVGTDFTMLMKLFPDRTRKEIKNKFKKEEKYHRILVDKAIDQRQKFDMAILEKFEQERRDYLELVRSEEARVKQQKLNARLEKKRLREEKRKQTMKENQLRRSHRKRRKTMYDDVPDELEEMSAERDMDVVEDLHSKRKEVVEILVNMSYGCPSHQDPANSSDEGEKPSEAVPFVPRSIKPASEVKRVLATDIQEDPVVDLEVCTTPVKESLDNISTQNTVPHVEEVQTTHLLAPQLTQRPALSVMEVRQPHPLAGSSEAVARLQEEMADKKVQMILVPEESAGQTVIHVYIVPEGADSVTVDGRTVMLSPTHTPSPGQMMSPRYSAACPGEVKPGQPNSLLSPNQHQACSPAPCILLNQNIKGDSQETNSTRRQSSGSMLGRGDSAINRRDDASSQQSSTSGTSFEIGSASISALQEKATRTEQSATSRCPQPSGSSPERVGHQTQIESVLKISSSQNFTPLPSPSKLRKLSSVSGVVQSCSMPHVTSSLTIESSSSSCHMVESNESLNKEESQEMHPSTSVQTAIFKQEDSQR